MYKYITTQKSYTDLAGTGQVKFVAEDKVISRSTPAGKDLAHILMPLNEKARAVSGPGGLDILATPVRVIQALADEGAVPAEELRCLLEKKGVKTKSNDVTTLVRLINELQLGQPVKNTRVGVKPPEDELRDELQKARERIKELEAGSGAQEKNAEPAKSSKPAKPSKPAKGDKSVSDDVI